MTPRLGFVLAPEDGNDAPLLLRCAGLARSSLEVEGEATPRWSRFSQDMDARAKALRNAESSLRNAVCNNQFELHIAKVQIRNHLANLSLMNGIIKIDSVYIYIYLFHRLNH